MSDFLHKDREDLGVELVIMNRLKSVASFIPIIQIWWIQIYWISKDQWSWKVSRRKQ